MKKKEMIRTWVPSPGDNVIWEASSQGTTNTRIGKILAILEPGDSPLDLPEEILPKGLPCSYYKFDTRGSLFTQARALVEVDHTMASKTVKHYYTPRLSALRSN